MGGEAPDVREQEDCPSVDACDGRCDQHEPVPEPRENVRIGEADVSVPVVPDERDTAVAEVLAAHRLAGLNGYCGCGWAPLDRSAPGPEQHRTHLAEALAPLIAEREAKAWDRGHAACTCVGAFAPARRNIHDNPYRAALKDQP